MHFTPKRHRPKWGAIIAQNPRIYGKRAKAIKMCTFPGCGKVKRTRI